MKTNPPTTGSEPILPPKRPNRLVPTTFSTHPVHTSLSNAANLANLLPTGTVLVFRTLTPSFSNKGVCRLSNKCLTAGLIAFCSVLCLISTFTDSFRDCDGKLYYGIATFKGLYIFNSDYDEGDDRRNDDGRVINLETTSSEVNTDNNVVVISLSRFRLGLMDFVHGFVSLFVFLAFAFSDSDVQTCFFPWGGQDLDVLMMNLPLAAGIFSSFLFMIFPTTRRGIGYADNMPSNSRLIK